MKIQELKETKQYFDFIQKLELPTEISKVLKVKLTDNPVALNHAVELMTISALGINNEIYEFDIRYAYGEKILNQHLIDQAWHRSPLSQEDHLLKLKHNKIILYLCDFKFNNCQDSYLENQPSELKQLPQHYILGAYWQSIYHIYLDLPYEHPFNLEEVKSFSPSSLELLTEEDNRPLITIVTVVYNGELLIEQTIQSVINQTYSNIEYIIIDGSSNDRTLEIVNKYKTHISKCISEPDDGLYDAMNKGFKLAKGDFINFMNVGDLFANNSVLESLNFHTTETSICGSNIFFTRQAPRLICSKPKGYHIPHQAFFMHREDFKKHQFNTRFRYSADSELWFRYQPWQSAKLLPEQTISLSRFGGISTTPKYLLPRMHEHLEFENSPLKVIMRFLPKMLISPFLNESIIESLYFRFYGCEMN